MKSKLQSGLTYSLSHVLESFRHQTKELAKSYANFIKMVHSYLSLYVRRVVERSLQLWITISISLSSLPYSYITIFNDIYNVKVHYISHNKVTLISITQQTCVGQSSLSFFLPISAFWASINCIYSSGFCHNPLKNTPISSNLKKSYSVFFLFSIMAEISGSSNGNHSVSLNIKDDSTSADCISVPFLQKVFPFFSLSLSPLCFVFQNLEIKSSITIQIMTNPFSGLNDWFCFCFWCVKSWLQRLWGHISWYLLVEHQWLWIWAKTKSSLSQGYQLFGVWL